MVENIRNDSVVLSWKVLHEFDLLKELMLIVRCFLTVNVCDFSLSGGELFDRIAAEDYKMTEAEVINYLRQVWRD